MAAKLLIILPAVVAAFLAAVVLGQDSDAVPSVLPGGSDEILEKPYKDGFSCEGQGYGYYADVENNCQVFHICLPIEDNEGKVQEYAKWSFVCGNGTVFDQQSLTCNHKDDAFPCAESPSLYGAVEFGKVDKE